MSAHRATSPFTQPSDASAAGPRHARPRRSGVLRAAVTLSAAAAALAAAGTASAATPAHPAASRAAGGTGGSIGEVVTGSTLAGVRPVTRLALNPLAHTGTNPLDNTVGSQIADFPALSTGAVTGPLAAGDSLSQLPLVGPAVHAVTG